MLRGCCGLLRDAAREGRLGSRRSFGVLRCGGGSGDTELLLLGVGVVVLLVVVVVEQSSRVESAAVLDTL